MRRERADEYEKYNYDVGIKPLIEKALGVQTFREDREHESEFMTISYWEDIPAMARFTGRDPTDIHHLDRDPEFLIELPKSVQIVQLLTSHGRRASWNSTTRPSCAASSAISSGGPEARRSCG